MFSQFAATLFWTWSLIFNSVVSNPTNQRVDGYISDPGNITAAGNNHTEPFLGDACLGETFTIQPNQDAETLSVIALLESNGLEISLFLNGSHVNITIIPLHSVSVKSHLDMVGILANSNCSTFAMI